MSAANVAIVPPTPALTVIGKVCADRMHGKWRSGGIAEGLRVSRYGPAGCLVRELVAVPVAAGRALFRAR